MLAEQTLKAQGIDLSGSYRALGGARRDWYLEYQRDSGQYEEDMRITYEVDIDCIRSGGYGNSVSVKMQDRKNVL